VADAQDPEVQLTETRDPFDRLEVLKVLGDNTRYAIYLELARSPMPLATADIARTLGLHANTVRPHLERMRELGLLEQRVDSRGGVGRPQHLYTLAADAPSLGLEPRVMPLVARMLLRVASEAGVTGDDAVDVGREHGHDAARVWRGTAPGRALLGELTRLGFDPEIADGDDCLTIGFMQCPFRDLAEANPAVVCGLHRGLVEGFVEEMGDAQVLSFRSLVDRDGCQVDIDALSPA
jgi:predicted ArsR family transcriptional regulator